MNEQREFFERGLSECVEAGVPADLDLWENIEAKVAERPVPRQAGKSFGRRKLALVFVGAVVFGMGAYGASGYAYDLFQSELPGIDAKVEGVEIGRSQTRDGATVNIEWAYADTEFVVVGYTVEDHRDDRKYAENDAYLAPVFFDEQIGNPPMDEPHLDLTDETGDEFDVIGGTTTGNVKWWPLPLPNTAVFKTPDDFEATSEHEFRFEVPLIEEPVFEPGQDEILFAQEPIVGPYTFDFSIPIKSASTIPINETVEANGVEMTLKSVTDSPARPEATVCLERSPNRDYFWWPASNGNLDVRELVGGCWIVGLDNTVRNSRASVTIPSLDGVLKETGSYTKPGKTYPVEQEIVKGPWQFEVELPED